MFRFLTLFFLLLVFSAKGQFLSATIGVDGLTCSMCSNGVEKALLQLDFVKDVDMDLNENIAKVQFIEGKKVNINSLAKKVTDAGYSVRFMKSAFKFNNLPVANFSDFTFDGYKYVFIETQEAMLNGEVELVFLDKNLISRKDFAKWESDLREDKKIHGGGKNIFHITL